MVAFASRRLEDASARKSANIARFVTYLTRSDESVHREEAFNWYIREKYKYEELGRRRLQAHHKIKDQIEEEDRDELKRRVDNIERKNIGGRSDHGELALTDDDRSGGVAGSDLCHTRERVVCTESALALHLDARRKFNDPSWKWSSRCERSVGRKAHVQRIAKKITPPREKKPPVFLGD